MKNTFHDQIAVIIGPSLEGMGYELVLIRMFEGGRRTLQIMAERVDGKGMTVDDCASISHTVSALLDVEDPISGAYLLEVSSPGLDRPLVKREDFERYAGFEAKVETRMMLEGRKRFKGRIKGLEEENVLLATTEGPVVTIPLGMVQAAKLLLTDELIKANKVN